MVGYRWYEDHGGHAAIDGKRQFFDQFFVRHDPIFSGRQDLIDTFQLK